MTDTSAKITKEVIYQGKLNQKLIAPAFLSGAILSRHCPNSTIEVPQGNYEEIRCDKCGTCLKDYYVDPKGVKLLTAA